MTSIPLIKLESWCKLTKENSQQREGMKIHAMSPAAILEPAQLEQGDQGLKRVGVTGAFQREHTYALGP
jgi:hypothetical protein